MYEQETYLLQNQLNPFPVAGNLKIDDDGQLSFVLAPKAAGASLGWLEKELKQDDLKAKIESGDLVTAFSFPVSGVTIKWPKTLGGYAMKIDGPDRTWIVSLNYPSGGGVWQMINMVNAKKTTKPWKDALATAGAKG